MLLPVRGHRPNAKSPGWKDPEVVRYSQQEVENTNRLLYRTVPHNGGLVFAPERLAREVAAIHQAIRTSRSWGEFRAAPDDPQEFVRILVAAFDDQGEGRPSDADRFEGEMIPGFTEGDYPPWLQGRMDEYLPHAVLNNFATREVTAVNGSFYFIPEDKADEMCAALRPFGFEVVFTPDLPFH